MLGRASQTVWAPADGAENAASLMSVLELSRWALGPGPIHKKREKFPHICR